MSQPPILSLDVSNMRLQHHLTLWFIQLIYPHLRGEIILVYSAWIVFELILAMSKKKRLYAFGEFKKLLKEYF